ncbi:MAG TPA: methyltransferase domain-containing protein [Pedococcus sp.]|nr:methyltransferase domain-containing protein [Pedococcus sp.]
MFGNRFARHVARRYRKRGLGGTEQHIVDFLVGRGIEGASVLEIGGGVGELHLELLRRGAARATNLELVDAYDATANELASEAGVGDRIERRVLDIAATPGQVGPADVVVLHRVVCCYPDFERLLGAAADHAQRLLVFSHPPRNAASRLVLAAQNAAFRVSGRSFRTFAHPPARMLDVLGAHGLSPVYDHQGLVWRVAGLERPPA